MRGTKSDKLKGRKIVLGVTGSIAAVETVKLCRELIRHGAVVHVVMSKDAQQIVHPWTLEFASGRPVTTQIDGGVQHVALCGEVPDRADLPPPGALDPLGVHVVARKPQHGDV